jgi:hypothetical protein
MSVRKCGSLPDVNFEGEHPNLRADFKKFRPAQGGGGVHGFAKDGMPLVIERVGGYEVKMLADLCNEDTFRDFNVFNYEFLYGPILREATLRKGEPVEAINLVFDCTGMGLRQFHIPGIMLLKVLADLLQNIYPERLGRLFVVNAPVFFTAAWAIIKLWLDQRVIDKIHILGSNYKNVLLEHVDHDQLPSFLGGSCTCGHTDGGCIPKANDTSKGNPAAYRYEASLYKADKQHDHEVTLARESALHFKFASQYAWKLSILNEKGVAVHEEETAEGKGSVVVAPGKYTLRWTSSSLGSFRATKIEYSLGVASTASSPTKLDSATELNAEKGMSGLLNGVQGLRV